MLETAGYQALAALGGAQGLSLARTEGPDLILVDYHMPEMNGLAVAERLKADAATRRIPVIALTSGTAADANKLIAAGCIGFIPKPFDAKTFPGLIVEFVRVTVARRPRPASPCAMVAGEGVGAEPGTRRRHVGAASRSTTFAPPLRFAGADHGDEELRSDFRARFVTPTD